MAINTVLAQRFLVIALAVGALTTVNSMNALARGCGRGRSAAQNHSMVSGSLAERRPSARRAYGGRRQGNMNADGINDIIPGGTGADISSHSGRSGNAPGGPVVQNFTWSKSSSVASPGETQPALSAQAALPKQTNSKQGNDSNSHKGTR